MRTEPLFISAIIACPERAESGNTDVRGERHSYFLSAAESTKTIPTATAPRITDAQLSSRKELLESTETANTSRLRCEERKSRRITAMYECCNTEIKVQTGLSPFSPPAKLSISVVGINEIEVFSEVFPEVFPELFRLALHCFVSSENCHFGCGDG